MSILDMNGQVIPTVTRTNFVPANSRRTGTMETSFYDPISATLRLLYINSRNPTTGEVYKIVENEKGVSVINQNKTDHRIVFNDGVAVLIKDGTLIRVSNHMTPFYKDGVKLPRFILSRSSVSTMHRLIVPFPTLLVNGKVPVDDIYNYLSFGRYGENDIYIDTFGGVVQEITERMQDQVNKDVFAARVFHGNRFVSYSVFNGEDILSEGDDLKTVVEEAVQKLLGSEELGGGN